MVKLRVIIVNALQETLRRRVLYVVLFITIPIVSFVASQLVFLRMAKAAGEARMASNMAISTVQTTLGVWSMSAFFLALFLGAIGISGEVSSKTIVHILSRPVERGVYLFGRWFGLLIFLWAFFLLGVAGSLLLAASFQVDYSAIIWLGFVQKLVELTFFSGLGLALSAFMPPVLAGGCALLLASLPSLTSSALHHPNALFRTLATFVYYIAPVTSQADLVEQGFTTAALKTSYSIHLQVMLENLLYVIAVLLVAAVIFKRREVRVR